MEISFRLSAALLLSSALLAIFMAVFLILNGKKSSVQRTFILVHILIFIWSTGEFLRGITENDQLWRIFLFYEYIGVCFIGACWLAFCLEFVEIKSINYRKKIALLIFTPCLMFYILLLTNSYHHLFFPIYENDNLSFGPFFWLHTFVSYTYCLIGMIILIKFSIREYEIIKKQSFIIIFAVLISIITNALLLTDYINPGFDITPVSFMATLFLFMIATFRYRFLNVVPIALRKVFDSMEEAVIVVDGFNRISDFNRAYREMLGTIVYIEKDDKLHKFIEGLKSHIERNNSTDKLLEAILKGDVSAIGGEINVVNQENTWFTVNVQHVFSKRNRTLGRIITFNDITRYKEMVAELSSKNDELLVLNEELKGYSQTVEELAVAKERNRFARDVHDSLGHTLMLLMKLNEAIIIASQNNPDKLKELLDEATRVTSEGLKELKRSISGLKPYKFESGNLAESLNVLATQMKLSGANVEINLEDWDENKHSSFAVPVFRICQEAITNSIKHGRASDINVFIRVTEEFLNIFVIDNGQGCKDIKEGQGLTGMNERVSSLNGKISYSSDGETGFIVRAEIPLKGGGKVD